MRGGGGQTPRRTSSSEKWEEADKPTKEKETVREVRGDPRGGSQEAGTGKEGSVLSQGVKELGTTLVLCIFCGKVIVPFISPVTGSGSHGQGKGKGGPSRR